jgi:hypothetical protein
MLYLAISDIDDYIATARRHGAITHFDVMDCSRPGAYIYFLVATQPLPEAGYIAVWSDLLLQEEEPIEETAKTFHEGLQARIKERHREVAGLLQKGGLKLRPGIFSVEAPPIFRHRT